LKAKEFVAKWGLTQKQLSLLLDQPLGSVKHWTASGSHDADRTEPIAVQQSLLFWDILFTLWLESEQRFSTAQEIFQTCREKGKGTAFQHFKH
jgi:hypothetical protein